MSSHRPESCPHEQLCEDCLRVIREEGPMPVYPHARRLATFVADQLGRPHEYDTVAPPERDPIFEQKLVDALAVPRIRQLVRDILSIELVQQAQ